MVRAKHVVAIILAALTVASFSAAAEANFRCGYDRYGYHPSDFSGCYRYYRQGWGFYPAYGFRPADSYYAPPRYAPVYLVPPPVYYVPTYGCYYDNGYDLRPHLICPRGW
jgi:hypothetical protein